MKTEMNIKELLEWYVDAGVMETSANEVMSFEQPQVIENNIVRKAMTTLAQDTVDAVKSSRDMCEGAHNLEALKQAVMSFEGCALKLTAANTVFGDGNPNSKIMLIGEAPGADEDRAGLPFVGRSGQLLDKMLKAINLSRNNYYITNVLPWRPPGNRTPTTAEIAVCLPILKRQIELIKPEIIFLLGGSAANALLDNAEPISKLRGKWLEYKLSNGVKVDVITTFHPAYLLRNSAQKAKSWVDLVRVYKKLNNSGEISQN